MVGYRGVQAFPRYFSERRTVSMNLPSPHCKWRPKPWNPLQTILAPGYIVGTRAPGGGQRKNMRNTRAGFIGPDSFKS